MEMAFNAALRSIAEPRKQMSSAAVLDATETNPAFSTANYDLTASQTAETFARPRFVARAKSNSDFLFIAAEGNRTTSYQIAKRAVDIVGASLILVALSPVMLFTLIVLTITTKGKPFYSQHRVGFRGKQFRMWKFRTMRLDADQIKHTVVNEADGPVFKNRQDPRITKFGRYLRKFSIDETPQLFSVLSGEMSLVGPRPLVPAEMAKVEPWQYRRLAVMPGLTCLWQVSGRSNIGFEEWAKMDVWYVENQNLLTDLWLLWRTPLTVITGKGAY
jgi:lipopolysaccharide/colanic/teichoic acid biosynthesis glycosyltransferase